MLEFACFINTHVKLSMSLLICVSIKHLAAVKHPRTVSIHSQRVVAATIITAVMDVARFMMCDWLSRISGSCV